MTNHNLRWLWYIPCSSFVGKLSAGFTPQVMLKPTVFTTCLAHLEEETATIAPCVNWWNWWSKSNVNSLVARCQESLSSSVELKGRDVTFKLNICCLNLPVDQSIVWAIPIVQSLINSALLTTRVTPRFRLRSPQKHPKNPTRSGFLGTSKMNPSSINASWSRMDHSY